jgi:hypothetical protein
MGSWALRAQRRLKAINTKLKSKKRVTLLYVFKTIPKRDN